MFSQIMHLNFLFLISFVKRQSFISTLMLIDHNKIQWLRENINTFLMLLGFYVSNNIFLYNIRLTSVYLTNRTPTPLLTNKAPFELLQNKKSSYSHLRAFGCLCYASTLLRHRINFSLWPTQAVFLRYPIRYKGYNLFDLATNTTFISRYVFH